METTELVKKEEKSEIKVQMDTFTEAEIAEINSLAQNLTPENLRHFGSNPLAAISKPADTLLQEVRGMDVGEASLAPVMSELELLDLEKVGNENKNFLAKIFGKARRTLADVRNDYQSLAAQTNNIAGTLVTQQNRLSDAEDVIIELGNVLADTAKELKKYIAAAQIELKDVLEVQIPEAKKRAEHDEFAQHDVYQLIDYSERLKMRIHSFNEAVAASFTQRNQLRITSKLVSDKISDLDETIAIAVPLIKSSVATTIAALTLEKAIIADQITRDTASNLLVSNTEKLRQLTQQMDEQRMQGVISPESMKQSREAMLGIIKEHFERSGEIERKRKEAEVVLDGLVQSTSNIMNKQLETVQVIEDRHLAEDEQTPNVVADKWEFVETIPEKDGSVTHVYTDDVVDAK